MSIDQVTVALEADLAALGVRRPALFLSASVPEDPKGRAMPDDVRAYRTRLANAARPREIRDAVQWLCRYAFAEGIQLVFGGHPAISPLVLEVAREAGEGAQKLVFVFQSELYRTVIPQQTLELADWSAGRLVWTPAVAQVPGLAPSIASWEDTCASLTVMRRLMTRCPGLGAAIFVGGMDGCLEESTLFAEAARSRGVPALRYALASTDGAARELWARGDHSGSMPDPSVLERDGPSEALWGVFEDLVRTRAI